MNPPPFCVFPFLLRRRPVLGSLVLLAVWLAPGAAMADMPEPTCKEARAGRPVDQQLHYPLESRRLREQGKVVLYVHVTRLGYVDTVRLLESSGYPRLDDAAVQAVSSWCFRPALNLERESVDDWVKMPVSFTLEQ